MRTSIVVTIAAVSILGITPHATAADNPSVYAVGVAKIDITPTYPVRLSGFGFRRQESEGVTQRIWAKALAIDDGDPLVLLTLDTCGISAEHVRDLAERLAKKAKLKPERLAVAVTHTHTAPMLKGVLATLFGVRIPKEHQERIDRYTAELLDKLEKVSLAALADRKPAPPDLGYRPCRICGEPPNQRRAGRSRSPCPGCPRPGRKSARDLCQLRLPLCHAVAQQDRRRLGGLCSRADRRRPSWGNRAGVHWLRGGLEPASGVAPATRSVWLEIRGRKSPPRSSASSPRRSTQ